MCECPRCHRKFKSLTAFTAHQQVRYGALHPVQCLDPADVGLILTGRGIWAWSEPQRAARRAG